MNAKPWPEDCNVCGGPCRRARWLRFRRWLRRFRMEQWYFSGAGMAYYRALDDVWDNVPEARPWIAERKRQIDPRNVA